MACIAKKKRSCSLQTNSLQANQSGDHTDWRPYNLQTIHPAEHTIYRPNTQQTIQQVDHSFCSPFSLQSILCADHAVWKIHSLQTIWSVNSFLQAIGLGISFPASPEKNALIITSGIKCRLSHRALFEGFLPHISSESLMFWDIWVIYYCTLINIYQCSFHFT